MIASITGIFSSSLFIPLDCMLDTRGFLSILCSPVSLWLLKLPTRWLVFFQLFLVTNIRCRILKENCLNLLSIDSRGIFLNRSFHILLISMLCLDRSPGLRASGLDHVFRAVQVLFLFSLEKEDNNPCIAFLKARLTCH